MTISILLATVTPVDYPEFAWRLALDLVAIGILTHLLFLHRHGRRDLRDTFVIANVCVFAALSVIGSQTISVGVGFGLFAILSIIRLRSEPFEPIEIAYFFASLTLGLINGFEHTQVAIVLVLNALVLATAYVVDHRTLVTKTKTVRRRKVTLDTAETDPEALRTMLTERMGVEVVSVAITEIDYVQGTTSLVVRYAADPNTPRDPAPAYDD